MSYELKILKILLFLLLPITIFSETTTTKENKSIIDWVKKDTSNTIKLTFSFIATKKGEIKRVKLVEVPKNFPDSTIEFYRKQVLNIKPYQKTEQLNKKREKGKITFSIKNP